MDDQTNFSIEKQTAKLIESEVIKTQNKVDELKNKTYLSQKELDILQTEERYLNDLRK